MITINKQRLGITVLGSGSSGNAIVLHADSGSVLVDAGFSGKELQRRLDLAEIEASSIRAILVSHEHGDHAKGVGVLARRWDLPVYANRQTAEVLCRKKNEFPTLRLFTAGQSFNLEDFTVVPFSIPHDAVDPVAFTVHWGDRKVGIATDLGHVSRVTAHHLQQCDGLVLESNHDVAMLRDSDRPWSLKRRILSRHGHLSNEAGMQLMADVLDARTRYVIFGHASCECNRYELIEEAVGARLSELGRTDLGTLVARQDEVLETCWLDGGAR